MSAFQEVETASGRVVGISEQAQLPPAKAASPISSRLPANFDEDETIGELGDRGSTPGNRWPRPETLALLKIRSEMDEDFRDATLKGPLWDEVSRKLLELGYKRNAKKCKEKFENVHKYYKRTKEGRASRHDGKNYKFFTQLEAIHTGSTSMTTSTPSSVISAASPTPISFSTGQSSAMPVQAVTPISAAPPASHIVAPQPAVQVSELNSQRIGTAIGISYSSTSSFYSSDSDEGTADVVEGGGDGAGRRKRKRNERRVEGGSKRKLMVFFEGLMKQVMDRQEAIQQKLLQTLEKQEADRLIREDSWRRQEMTRLRGEEERVAQERIVAANRDAALISYIEKLNGDHSILSPLPSQPQKPSAKKQSAAVPAGSKKEHHIVQAIIEKPSELGEQNEPTAGSLSFEPNSSSRWPKSEVHALINLRSNLESRYQENGPKGPLWEEISVEMQRLGYNRSSKRCKEKWENINKYFKKVKESNKKRPEDGKTCPYFHQLDAIYRQRILTCGDGSSANSAGNLEENISPKRVQPLNVKAPPPAETPANNGSNTNGESNSVNGGVSLSLFGEEVEKAEDRVKELQHTMMDNYDNEGDSDTTMDKDGGEDDDNEKSNETINLQYKIQFQRQNISNNNGGNSETTASTKVASTNAGSFLAMVQ